MATLNRMSPIGTSIVTPRLRIRPVNTRRQAIEIFRLAMSTDIHTGLKLPEDLTFDQFRGRLTVPPVFILFRVEVKHPESLVGLLAIWEQSPIPDWPQILFGIHPDHRGRGYAKEAALALLSHLIERMNLPGVCAISEARNPGSLRVLESLGMHCGTPAAERQVFVLSREDHLKRLPLEPGH